MMGSCKRVSWDISRRETRTYDRSGNGFKSSSALQKGEWQNNVMTGVVQGSFVTSARKAGLSSGEVSNVIKAL